ncbi:MULTISPECIES: MAPEG family protein [Aliiglaciecola]|uniref:MAPEG family protein n=1 Tax=Aliiglaciecola TaxID=1406885 RepID=UPI001C08CAF5|nr:MAPEG family protein [Aliiglaciecola lipolytica]MBU2877043.1 MAPEG family protein [Aliiglaciecola lipolytica]
MSTPITAFYAGLLGITFFYLSILVIKQRRGRKVSLGDGGDSHFLGIIRAHGNFAEYVPLILVLLLVAELNQGNHLILHAIGSLLLLGRIIHAYGLRHHTGVSWQRLWGMLMTFASLVGASVLNILTLY